METNGIERNGMGRKRQLFLIGTVLYTVIIIFLLFAGDSVLSGGVSAL